MELVSNWHGVEITPDELVKLIPDEVFTKIEEQVRVNSNKEYEKNLPNIEYDGVDEGKLRFNIYD